MSNFRNISIRKKLITIQVITSLVVLVTCLIIFTYKGLAFLKAASINKVNALAKFVGDGTAGSIQKKDVEDINRRVLRFRNVQDVHEVKVYDSKGNLIVGVENPKESENVFREATTSNFKNLQTKVKGSTLHTRYNIFKDGEYLGYLELEAQLLDLDAIIDSYLTIGGIALTIGLIITILISSLLERTVSTRMLRLVSTAKEVSRTGNYSVRISSEELDHDEIGTLGREFNNMLEQIENMQQSLKATNQSLEKRVQERTEELQSFSYSVSHDLKAPLRAINGFTDILVKKYDAVLDNKGKEIANTIMSNVKKMGRLIEDLLEFSRAERKDLTLETVSMNTIVNRVLDEAKKANEGRNVTINKTDLPDVHGDAALLTQVWTNYILNAFKYTSHKEQAEITIGSFKKEKDIVFFVRDNGAGFNMQYAEKLFHVFQRLHGPDEFEGSGLGLAIVARIVARMNGKVWAEGKVNEGATFYFSLPAK